MFVEVREVSAAVDPFLHCEEDRASAEERFEVVLDALRNMRKYVREQT
jgi:hypothetical protein